jgi:hypothetical protein
LNSIIHIARNRVRLPHILTILDHQVSFTSNNTILTPRTSHRRKDSTPARTPLRTPAPKHYLFNISRRIHSKVLVQTVKLTPKSPTTVAIQAPILPQDRGSIHLQVSHVQNHEQIMM